MVPHIILAFLFTVLCCGQHLRLEDNKRQLVRSPGSFSEIYYVDFFNALTVLPIDDATITTVNSGGIATLSFFDPANLYNVKLSYSGTSSTTRVFNRPGSTATNTGEITFDKVKQLKVAIPVDTRLTTFYWRVASPTSNATYKVSGIKAGKVLFTTTYTCNFNPAGTTYYMNDGYFSVDTGKYDTLQFVGVSGSYSIHSFRVNSRV